MKNLKLWLLVQNTVTGYDTYDSMVVAAATAEEASRVHPYFELIWDDKEKRWIDKKTRRPSGRIDSWPETPSDIKVSYLGEATEGILPGCILASFNAG